MDPRADADRGISPRNHGDVHQQPSQVVRDHAVALLARPRQLPGVQEGADDGRQARRVGNLRELDSVVGRDHTTGERRGTRPHVEEVDQRPAGREMAQEGFADPPNGYPLGQGDVCKLPFGADAERQRSGEGDSASDATGRPVDR